MSYDYDYGGGDDYGYDFDYYSEGYAGPDLAGIERAIET